MKSIWNVIKGPVVTEKALELKEETQDKKQLLTFRVDVHANKNDIKEAVEKIFQVKVESVRIANYQGKLVRRGRTMGRRSSWKKAYVTLKAGQPVVDYAAIT